MPTITATQAPAEHRMTLKRASYANLTAGLRAWADTLDRIAERRPDTYLDESRHGGGLEEHFIYVLHRALAMRRWVDDDTVPDDDVLSEAMWWAADTNPEFAGLEQGVRYRLAEAGIITAAQVATITDRELLALDGIGRVSVRALRAITTEAHA
jgi:hypothetical protein